MHAIALVCARGGSKGLPGKNLRPFRGRPLVAHAVMQARAAASVARVLVSTDDPAIAEAARAEGADVPFLRPADLAGDRAPEWLVWRHALEHLQRTEGELPAALVVVPPTAPLRLPADIDRAVAAFAEGDADVVVTVTAAHRNPWFNMVTLDASGHARLVNAPAGPITRRQDVPVVHDMTTVAYVARPAFVLAHDGLFAGRVRAVEVPPERAVDIDTLLDFRIAECLAAEAAA
ncbi:MAG: acylneuraminate cytidylyltransferase family protein [Gemmatimonadaceae bacterium]|jgi:N-acylneuraminate cytidylyltransferase|nr:acylneuraminate cytidylyltransferase family protein [Gemmatimonadaceae bacterium]